MESDGSMAGIGIDRDGRMFGSCWHLAKFVLKAVWQRDGQALQFARRLTWELDGRLRDHAAAGPLVLPEVPLQELILETELGVGTGELRIEDGGTGPYERFCIAAITRCLRPRYVFEIGTFRGQTTALLARNTPSEARIFTLDLEAGQARHLRIQPAAGDLKYINKARIGEHIDGRTERGGGRLRNCWATRRRLTICPTRAVAIWSSWTRPTATISSGATRPMRSSC